MQSHQPVKQQPPTSPIICLCNEPGTQQQPQSSSRKPALFPQTHHRPVQPRLPTPPRPSSTILNHKSRHHPRPPAAGTSGPPGRWPPLGRPAASCCSCARRCGSPRTTGVSTCRRPASPPASAGAGRRRPAQPARDPVPPGAAARAGAAAARRTRAAGPAAR